jgi:hypothetical protein
MVISPHSGVFKKGMFTMGSLRDINEFVMDKLKGRVVLNPVSLKFPFPERPLRTLGLVKIEGEVYSSERFIRILLMKATIPWLRDVYSIYFNPREEFDLPIFTSDIVIKGRGRLFILDIHRREGGERTDDTSSLYERLMEARGRYPFLLKSKTSLRGPIQNIFSKAACLVTITEDQDSDALELFKGYLDVFLEVVEGALPLTGEALAKAHENFERYLKTIVEYDPGVKVYTRLFGKEGGVTRALDLFFGQ